MSRTDVMPGNPYLRPRYVAAGIVSSASLATVASLLIWTIKYEAAGLSVDGGGGASVGIFLIANIIGLIFGMPIATVILRFWPTDKTAWIIGLVLFATIVGFINSRPILSFAGWVEGAAVGIVFCVASIGLGIALQRLRTTR